MVKSRRLTSLGKIDFTIEEKAFLLECNIRNDVNRQPIKRLYIASMYNSN
jgi:hypothetical protein